VVGVCNVSSILAGALDAAISARTRVTIFDGEGDVGSLTPVFDTQGPHVGSSQGRPVRIDGAFVHTAQLTLPMRTWTVVVRPSENYSSPIERAAEYMFLVAGLAICVKIVEQMGGDITIEGNEGGGSIFVFTLPQSRLPGRQVLD
jgi:CHASE1-domain containing sensor protein